MVSLILEFQILDEDAIPALVKSLSVGRRIVRKQWRGAIPIEIVNKSETDRIERLLIPKGASLNVMRSLIEEPDARKYLTSFPRNAQRTDVRPFGPFKPWRSSSPTRPG